MGAYASQFRQRVEQSEEFLRNETAVVETDVSHMVYCAECLGTSLLMYGMMRAGLFGAIESPLMLAGGTFVAAFFGRPVGMWVQALFKDVSHVSV
jgi:hypothetical protein